MANTRQSTKRTRQAQKRQTRNVTVRGATRSALSGAIQALKTQDVEKAKNAYKSAIKALSKAASKGAIPKGRASRKIARLTHLAQKVLPAVVPTSKK